jgi:hypothetical protein
MAWVTKKKSGARTKTILTDYVIEEVIEPWLKSEGGREAKELAELTGLKPPAISRLRSKR